jgi:hypothetical protein
MFWITVGHARRHTACEMGPSTIDRSNLLTLEMGGIVLKIASVLEVLG